MFDRRRQRRTRSDVSLVTEVIVALGAARVAGAPIPVRELPVAVGLANLHADVLAAMPLVTGGRGTTPEVIRRPNPDESRHSTVHKLVQSAWWTGNAFVMPSRRRDAITVLDPNRVGPGFDPDDPLNVPFWYYDGEIVAKDQIHWFKINDDPRYGAIGRSPLSMASEPLTMYGYAYSYLSMFFAGGGNPSTVLRRTGPGNTVYSPAEAAEDWVEARKERRPAVLPAGWELQVPANNGEMEAIGRILEQCASEVARLVNAPPSLANAKSNGSMTYSNVHGEIARWLSFSLVPTWIARLEDFWSELAGVEVTMDTDVMFRLVSPTDAGGMPDVVAPMPRLEAVA
jgi:phage portal protein BeeE